MNIQVKVLIASAMAVGVAGQSSAGTIIDSGKVASGTIVGDTIMVINSPSGELGLSTSSPSGPNWNDDSMDGFRHLSGGTDSGLQGTSPWEADGSSTTGQLRFFGTDNAFLTSYTFNLADAGIDLPDGAVINAVYATWTIRGVSDGRFRYTEGAQSGDTGTITQTAAPAADLAINWTDNTNTVRTANFQQIFNTPITVEGGDGFTISVSKVGNTTQTDAIILDVTIPEPSSLALLGLGGLLIARRRR